LNKIEFALKLDEWCLNGGLREMLFLYSLYGERTNRWNKKLSRGNLSGILLGLGL
jgi:hypothetical protein